MEQHHPQERPAPSSFLRLALLCLELLDEFLSGFLVIGLPLIRRDLHLTYAQAGLLFTVGSVAITWAACDNFCDASSSPAA